MSNDNINRNFNVEVAKDVGTDAAIILSNIEHWAKVNKANNRNYHDGRYWTYNSVSAFNEIFNYLSPKKIRTCLRKLEDKGYIVSGCYNKVAYDRTKWYAPKGQMDLPKSANGIAQTGEPIPDIKPDNKPDSEKVDKSTPLKSKSIYHLDRDTTLKQLEGDERLQFRIAKSLNTFFAKYQEQNGNKIKQHIKNAKVANEMKPIELLLKDYSESQIKKVIRWFYDGKTQDARFWQMNIQSCKKFREKFETMNLVMKNPKHKEQRL